MTSIENSLQIISFGYYDGPTNGLLRVEQTGREYWFNCFATIMLEDADLRGIKLYPLPAGTLDAVAGRLYKEAPLPKIAVVMGDFYRHVETEVEEIIPEIERLKGAPEKVIAWQDPGLTIIGETTSNLLDDKALVSWLNELGQHNAVS